MENWKNKSTELGILMQIQSPFGTKNSVEIHKYNEPINLLSRHQFGSDRGIVERFLYLEGNSKYWIAGRRLEDGTVKTDSKLVFSDYVDDNDPNEDMFSSHFYNGRIVAFTGIERVKLGEPKDYLDGTKTMNNLFSRQLLLYNGLHESQVEGPINILQNIICYEGSLKREYKTLVLDILIN